MAPTSEWHCTAILKQWGTTTADRVNYTGDDIMISLIDDAVAPLQDTHDYWNDLSANEVGTAQTLGGKTLTLDTGTNTVKFDCSDPQWTAPGEFRYAVIWKDDGVAEASSVILGNVDFESNQTATGVFTLQVSADGLLEGVIA